MDVRVLDLITIHLIRSMEDLNQLNLDTLEILEMSKLVLMVMGHMKQKTVKFFFTALIQ